MMNRGNMSKQMQQLQQLQNKMAKAQEDLGNETVEGTAGGGAVKIVMTGHQRVTQVTIEPEAAEDVDLLQDMIMTAVNDAQTKATDLAQKRMGAVTAGLGLPPGLF